MYTSGRGLYIRTYIHIYIYTTKCHHCKLNPPIQTNACDLPLHASPELKQLFSLRDTEHSDHSPLQQMDQYTE